MEERFYTISEIADLLSLSEQTVRKLIKEHKISAIKLGHCYRIPYTSIQSLLLNINKVPKD